MNTRTLVINDKAGRTHTIELTPSDLPGDHWAVSWTKPSGSILPVFHLSEVGALNAALDLIAKITMTSFDPALSTRLAALLNQVAQDLNHVWRGYQNIHDLLADPAYVDYGSLDHEFLIEQVEHLVGNDISDEACATTADRIISTLQGI